MRSPVYTLLHYGPRLGGQMHIFVAVHDDLLHLSGISKSSLCGKISSDEVPLDVFMLGKREMAAHMLQEFKNSVEHVTVCPHCVKAFQGQ